MHLVTTTAMITLTPSAREIHEQLNSFYTYTRQIDTHDDKAN